MLETDFAPVLADESKLAELQETVRKTGHLPIKIIGPGWGSSGYYSPEMIDRDGHIFESIHMYWDHPTKTAKRERPERSLKDLAAVVEGKPHFDESGWAGPGLYADAKVFSSYREQIAEMAPHIGVSIQADGVVAQGTAPDGKKGRIVEAMTKAQSVDFVTQPGAGGAVKALFEAARGLNEIEQPEPGPEEVDMGDLEEARRETAEAQTSLQEMKKERDEAASALTESKRVNDEQATKIARFDEAQLVVKAKGVATEVLKGQNMPDATRTRIIEAASMNPPTTEGGALDEPKLRESVTNVATAEAKYLKEVIGAGKVTGMGGGSNDDGDDLAEAEKSLQGSLQELGLSEATAKEVGSF